MNPFRPIYLALGISAIAATMIAATVFWFVHNDRERRALDDARDYITGTEDARDAQDAIPDDQPSIIDWLSRFSTD